MRSCVLEYSMDIIVLIDEEMDLKHILIISLTKY